VTVLGRRDSLGGYERSTSCPFAMTVWFRRLTDAEANPPTPGPVPYGVLTAELRNVPATVQRGSDLTYEVVLTNPTGAPVRLDPCPAYTQELQKAKLIVRNLLNCAAAPVVPAHGSVVFTMILKVPSNTTLITNPTYLSWSVDGVAGLSALSLAPIRLTD
jgi:hypothetical protein